MACQESPRVHGAKAAMLAALVLAAWPAQAAAASCSTDTENCNVTRCCTNPKSTCYEKNAEYASCHPGGCKKGLHDDDEGEWKTPWSCKLLNRDACSTAKGNCNVTKCCQDMSLTCYEKNDEFAKCSKGCVKGVHKGDAPPWNTPWSCKALAPSAAGKAPAPVEVAMPSASKKKAGDEGDGSAGEVAEGNDGKCNDIFGKCGGKNYKGVTCCQAGCRCKKFGIYHSSCQPAMGQGHRCEAEVDSFRLVEVDDGAAEDEHIAGGSLAAVAQVTQMSVALAAVGGVIFFVAFLKRARRRRTGRQHMLVEAEDAPAREVRVE